ncbi:MAG TPA: hypothetical protein VM452_13420 [Caulifigura sp.]|jgi:hypothetical protein|nr:hypothetical protein [Caulifigura sp.]
MNGRLKQAVAGLLVVSSVSAVGASVTFSQLHGAARIKRAVQSAPKAAPKAAARIASESVVKTESALAAAGLSERETATLSKVARTHRVQLSNGSVTGAIQSLSGGAIHNLTDIRVSFFQNGSLVTQVTPGSDGVFAATLAPGVYTLVAYGKSGYAAYGVHVVDPTAEVRSAGYVVADSHMNLQIETLAVPPVDFSTVYRLARSHMTGPVPGPVPTRTDSMPDLPAENALPQTNIKHHTVTLEADGSLLGKLKRIHPQTGDVLRVHSLSAFLVQNGSVVHQAGVAEDGSLKFSSVKPGVYSFVTAGSEGFSAFSIVVAPAAATASADAIRPVSFQADGGPLTATPGAPSDIGPATDPLGPGGNDEGVPPVGDVPPGGAGGGGFGGGSGGGFGGGGGGLGGGGLGLVLGALGAGLGAAALADNNNNDNNGPVSPANP